LYGAGGVSSLPSIHGLADDRLRIKVDGMDLIASCPNHMNPALSYIDPSNVGVLKIYAGITPVSAGGDSIGGTIIAESRAPEFSAPGQGALTKGEAGAFYRSNNKASGLNLSASYATEQLSVSYRGATAKADNYSAGADFMSTTATGRAGHTLPLSEVGSSAFDTTNHTLALAFRNDRHLFEVKLGIQDMPFQLYPNQRMDMLYNKQDSVNLRYVGQFDWGAFVARAYQENVDHYMDFGADKKLNYGSITGTSGKVWPVDGMPMYTKGKTTGASMKADVQLNARDLLRSGAETQTYRLDDWWPSSPNCGVGECSGGMAPNTFWNINGGQRDRSALFSEWEATWSPQWLSLLGLRAEQVTMNTGKAQGYNTGMMYTSSSVGTTAAFNALDLHRNDQNLDLTALARHTPDANRTYEFGFAQKTRSPNVYERYDWSANAMAMEMNNFVGDGNAYVGNPHLKPEVAHTLSFTGDWHSDDGATEFKLTPYYTRVNDYIDAVRRPTSVSMMGVSDNNATTTSAFVKLQYANQAARLYGVDISGKMSLTKTAYGDFGLKGLLNYTSGKNMDTDSGLYNIMPLNTKLTLTQKLGDWSNALEVLGVSAKTDVSAVRNEAKTPGYSLVSLRANYVWKQASFDFGIENLFDKFYYLPLGGAYTGQGATMSLNREVGNIATNGGTASLWGTGVPGMGRSIYVGVNVKF
jgi:iron complex outermembrane receptor protein